MDRRTIIAILLSLGVWVGFMYFWPQGKPEQKQAQTTQQTQATQQAQQTQSPQSNAKTDSKTDKAAAPIAVSSTAKRETIALKTTYYNAVLSNVGAKIESIKYGSRQIELTGTPVNEAKGVLDFSLLFSENEILEGNALQSAVWNVKKINDLTIQFAIASKIQGKPVTIEKIYTFNEHNPSFDLSLKITNNGNDALTFNNGSIIVSPGDSLGPKMDEYGSVYNKIQQIYYANGSLKYGDKGHSSLSCSTSSPTDIKTYFENEVHWFGMISRYFTVVMIPLEVKAKNVVWDGRETGSYRIGATIPAEQIPARNSITKKFRVAISEKEKEKLSLVDPGIIPAMDVSKYIEPLRNGILLLLKWINMLFGNIGVSIIILSFITKLVFLPLTIKSTESMKRMTELQPKIAALKEKYKDQPEKIQKATVELYKVHKVNPLGGCLPILIQMPFFIALYSALSTSFDLWHSPFCLWIKDLSSPDTLFTVHGFNINILPLFWAGSTFLQQKMTATPAATGGQQWVMKLMPLMLLFIFWTMPSGLTLYWTIQNVLQIAHQVYVNKYKKTPAKEAE
jgi:YidC/Oxa1 family membrane protein insertase